MKKHQISLILILIFVFSAVAQDDKKLRSKEDNNETLQTEKTKKSVAEDTDKLANFAIEEFKIPKLDTEKYSFGIKETKIEEFNPTLKNKTEEKEVSKKDVEKRQKYEVLFSVKIDSLSNNLGNWKQASLFTRRKFEDGKILWGEYRSLERVQTRDKEVIGGIYTPLKNKYAVTLEGSYSRTGNFVPKFSVRAEGEKTFKAGWVGHLGVRYKKYSNLNVKTVYGEVEKYWGNNRLAYTLSINDVSNSGTAPSNRLSYTKYYGERLNSFGFSVSAGKEEEFVDSNIGIIRSNTFSLTGSVKQWISKDFGLFVDATLHRQGSFYYRRGLNFGLRYRF